MYYRRLGFSRVNRVRELRGEAFSCYGKRPATLPGMGTITIGYGEADDGEVLVVEHGGKFDVSVREGALQVDMPGRYRIYAPGFWHYVDVETDADNMDD